MKGRYQGTLRKRTQELGKRLDRGLREGPAAMQAQEWEKALASYDMAQGAALGLEAMKALGGSPKAAALGRACIMLSYAAAQLRLGKSTEAEQTLELAVGKMGLSGDSELSSTWQAFEAEARSALRGDKTALENVKATVDSLRPMVSRSGAAEAMVFYGEAVLDKAPLVPESEMEEVTTGTLRQDLSEQSVPTLITTLREHPDPSARRVAMEALYTVGTRKVVEPLMYAAIEDSETDIRLRATELLGKLPFSEVDDALDVVFYPTANIEGGRQTVVDALAERLTPKAIHYLMGYCAEHLGADEAVRNMPREVYLGYLASMDRWDMLVELRRHGLTNEGEVRVLEELREFELARRSDDS